MARRKDKQTFSVYLPWVQHSGAVHIEILRSDTSLVYRVVPQKVTVRPGTPVVWDDKSGSTLIFSGVWNGSPLLSARIEPMGSFTAVFQSAGTLEWSVQN